MHSLLLKLSGIILISMVPFTCSLAVQPEFEKIVYKRTIGDVDDIFFSFEVDLEYYRMKGGAALAKRFNRLIHTVLYGNLLVTSGSTPEDYVKSAITMFEKDKNEHSGSWAGYGFHMSGRGEITWSDERLITAKLASQSYSAGAAHPLTYETMLNIDPKTGERVDMLDFITDKIAFVTAVQEKLIGALPDGEKQLWDQVPLPSNMGMTEAGLRLVYNEYEILSYAQGKTELLIPMDELQRFSLFKPTEKPKPNPVSTGNSVSQQ